MRGVTPADVQRFLKLYPHLTPELAFWRAKVESRAEYSKRYAATYLTRPTGLQK